MVLSRCEGRGFAAEEKLSAETGTGQDICSALTHSYVEEFGVRAAYPPPEQQLVVFTPWANFGLSAHLQVFANGCQQRAAFQTDASLPGTRPWPCGSRAPRSSSSPASLPPCHGAPLQVLAGQNRDTNRSWGTTWWCSLVLQGRSGGSRRSLNETD